jgi:hypothetical protein
MACLFLLATLASSLRAEVNSLFLSGLSFFQTGDLDESAEDLRTGDLSPGFDGDFLLSFRDSHRTSVLAGFGIFWSRRTEDTGNLPFEEPREGSRIEMLGFPLSIGFARRDPARTGAGWFYGALAHYYFLSTSVRADPSLGEIRGFSVGLDGEGERGADGPGVSVFFGYEVPFFLGSIGAGIKGRWTSLSVDEKPGPGTPEYDISGVTLFLSAALR